LVAGIEGNPVDVDLPHVESGDDRAVQTREIKRDEPGYGIQVPEESVRRDRYKGRVVAGKVIVLREDRSGRRIHLDNPADVAREDRSGCGRSYHRLRRAEKG
jgi:hypothetical protein